MILAVFQIIEVFQSKDKTNAYYLLVVNIEQGIKGFVLIENKI